MSRRTKRMLGWLMMLPLFGLVAVMIATTWRQLIEVFMDALGALIFIAIFVVAFIGSWWAGENSDQDPESPEDEV